MALVIGVTGGSGAGKTTVVSILSQLGMERLDVDRVAHKFLLPGSPVFEKIVATFGEEYRQEEGIDRKRLGRLVFSSPAHRRKLEALVHPLLKKRWPPLSGPRGEPAGTWSLTIPCFLRWKWRGWWTRCGSSPSPGNCRWRGL